MSTGDPERGAAFEARHAAIIGRTLRWADEAAARRDYRRAVHWIETVRGLGHGLPREYEGKLGIWLNAIDRDREARN
jgi:hypothetical protein